MLRILLFISLVFAAGFVEDICNEKYMKKITSSLSSNLKNKEDKDIKFTSECRDNTIILNSYLLIDVDFSQETKDNLDFKLQEKMCKKQNEILADLGLFMKGRIFSKSGSLLHEIEMDPNNCPNFSKSQNLCDKQYIISIVDKISEGLPKSDKKNKITGVVCNDNMFIYKVVTSMDYPVEGSVLAKRRNKELKDMQKAYCKDDNKVIRELKIPFRFEYYLPDDTLLFTTSIKPDDCANF